MSRRYKYYYNLLIRQSRSKPKQHEKKQPEVKQPKENKEVKATTTITETNQTDAFEGIDFPYLIHGRKVMQGM
jgi:hypothetical protein